ncbi:MAG: glycosyltransferase family 4 protein [Desulfurococcaceae archaeon]
MKVMLVTLYYPPYASGGIGPFNYELAKGFSKNSIDVVVVAGGSNDVLLKNHKIKVYFLEYPKLKPKEFYFHLYNAKRIAKIVEKEKPDVIQLNSGNNAFLKLLKDRNSYHGIITYVFHGAPPPFSRPYEDLRTLNIYDIIWTLAFQIHEHLGELISDPIEYVDAFIHVARHVMYYNLNYSRLRERLREKLNIVIYTGINIEDFERLKLEVSSKGKKRKSLIFGARLVPYKGITYLLEAFELAWQEDKEISLSIFGDGPLRSHVIRKIRDMQRHGIRSIRYHGRVPREAFLKAVARSHILIHPSLYEASPMVLIESSLLGTPVLAHDAPYSEEFVKKLGIGEVINTRDIHKFADAIVSIVNDDGLLCTIIKSLDRIRALFDINKTIEKYIELYQKFTQ